jgi:hypothetical protein
MLAGNLMRSLHRNTIKVCKLHKLLTNLGNNLIDVPNIYIIIVIVLSYQLNLATQQGIYNHTRLRFTNYTNHE